MIKLPQIFFLYVMAIVGPLLASSSFNVLYVSPKAEKYGNGSSEAPFRTIQQARDFIRASNPEPGQQFVVKLHEGTYFMEETLVLDQRDSAPVGGKITYTACEGEKPVLSGGRKITGWQAHENGIWKAEAGNMRFRQLYVDGVPAIRARFPEQGEFLRLERADIDGQFVVVPSAFLKKWDGFPQVEMVVNMLWAESILRLKDFSPDEGDPHFSRLTFQEPESSLVFNREWPKFVQNQSFHFENAYEFINCPGEWWQDQKSGTVYYMPRKGQDMTQVEVIGPRLDTLVRICGTPESTVNGLQFSGITFSHTNWLRPSEQGHLNGQAGQFTIKPTDGDNHYVSRMPSAFVAEFARQILVERCVFTQLGAQGLDLRAGTVDNSMVGNVFYDLAGGGILLGDFSPPDVETHQSPGASKPGKISSKNVVANNYIRHIGTAYPGCCGIAAGYVSNTVIENNEITDLPYTGISIGWGWSSKPSALHDNTVRFNHVHSVMRELTDGAGIYTLSLQPGTQVYRNQVHDIKLSPMSHDPLAVHQACGIYFDEASGGTAGEPFIVRENVVYNIVLRYNFHIVGTILFDGNLDYMDPWKLSSQRYPGRVIAEQTGITDKYSDMKKTLPFRPYSPYPEFKEILSRAQMEKRNLTGASRQIVMTAELDDDPDKIKEYERFHSVAGVWPEVIDAAKVSGIEKSKIYRFDNRLFMVLDLPKDADPSTVFKCYDTSSERITEWAKIMAGLQKALPGQPKTSRWVPMKMIHDYEFGEVR